MSESAIESGVPPAGARALCLDLDGTLIATDALWESFLLLVKQRPHLVPLVPFWLLSGRARLKRKLADLVLPNAATLPYRPEVIAYVEKAKAEGRPVHLVTASDQKIADAVAAHLGLFDEAIGSDGTTNLKAERKKAYLEERFGAKGYDYIGDSSADLVLFASAGRALLVSASPSTVAKAKSQTETEEIVPRDAKRLGFVIKALRPHQWTKNVLLFVAAILAHKYTDVAVMAHALAGFAAFSLVASSVYVLNDLLDLEADRQHRTKKNRPFAAGKLSIPFGLALSSLVAVMGLSIALVFTPPLFGAVLVGYLVLTTAYSVYLKRKLIVDVLTLAGLFTYRVIAGGVAADVPVSFWLLGFSMFFFTGLAFVKRYSEVVAIIGKDQKRVPGRNYWAEDLDIIKTVGPACGLLAVLVFCLYINSANVQELYPRPEALWLIAPVMLYWITRIWFLAARNQLDDDPVVFALSDRISHLAALVTGACILAAKL
jgi:4-hydroxybenzoate polyprenyltransferase/phosphoserine phosphatase